MAIPRITLAAGNLGGTDGIEVGSGTVDLRGAIIKIINIVLSYVALLAVVMIIFAGIWMIAGAYDESSKEKAKKMIIYTIIGLLIIMLAKAIVELVLNVS